MLGAGGIELMVGAQKPGWEGPRRPSLPRTVVLILLIQRKEISKTRLSLTTTDTLAPHTKRLLPQSVWSLVVRLTQLKNVRGALVFHELLAQITLTTRGSQKS